MYVLYLQLNIDLCVPLLAALVPPFLFPFVFVLVARGGHLRVPGRPRRRVPGGVRPVRRRGFALQELLPGIPVGRYVRRPGDARLLGHSALHHRFPPHPGRSREAVRQRLSQLRSPVGGASLPEGCDNGRVGPLHALTLLAALRQNVSCAFFSQLGFVDPRAAATTEVRYLFVLGGEGHI